jgi:23S rRNA-/tRNA-specific pseudouridylate synthase
MIFAVIIEPMKILFEDKDVLVIDKPAGVVANEAKTARGETVQAWMANYLVESRLAKFVSEESGEKWFESLVSKEDMRELIPADFDDMYGTPEEIFSSRWGIVHRLDKDTSGVMVLAKNPGALVALLDQFKKRQTKKEYMTLVHGQLDPEEGTLTFPLGRSKSNFKKIVVQAGGRKAETNYQVTEKLPFTENLLEKIMARVGEMNSFSTDELSDAKAQMKKTYQQGFSWVKCQPKTGRMHQIRVHMNATGHPLVGDPLYLGRKRLKMDRLWTDGQVLSAVKLEFRHPRSGEHVEIGLEQEDAFPYQKIFS